MPRTAIRSALINQAARVAAESDAPLTEDLVHTCLEGAIFNHPGKIRRDSADPCVNYYRKISYDALDRLIKDTFKVAKRERASREMVNNIRRLGSESKAAEVAAPASAVVAHTHVDTVSDYIHIEIMPEGKNFHMATVSQATDIISGTPEAPRISWPSIGAVSIADAEVMLSALALAIDEAKKLAI